MAARPEERLGELLQVTKDNAIEVLKDVKPKPDWSAIIRRSVLSLGIIPAWETTLSLIDEKRENFWDLCQIRKVKGIFTYGRRPIEESEIVVRRITDLGNSDLIFKRNGEAVLIEPMPGRMWTIILMSFKPYSSAVEECRAYVQEIRQKQTA